MFWKTCSFLTGKSILFSAKSIARGGKSDVKESTDSSTTLEDDEKGKYNFKTSHQAENMNQNHINQKEVYKTGKTQKHLYDAVIWKKK